MEVRKQCIKYEKGTGRMSERKAVRAFESDKYNYYKLTKDLAFLKAGAIFYYDPDDYTRGSISDGCLKLCWTPDGNCYSGIAGGTVVFHTAFIDTDLFEKVDRTFDNIADQLDYGVYRFVVNKDGWDLRKMVLQNFKV